MMKRDVSPSSRTRESNTVNTVRKTGWDLESLVKKILRFCLYHSI